MWLLMAMAGVAHAQTAQGCTKTSVGKLVKGAQQPSILVLGERKGTLPDLSRAKKIVTKLQKAGPVMLALQAVRSEHQGVLDRYARGELGLDAIPNEVMWEGNWGFPFDAYTPLLMTGRNGVVLTAIGTRYLLRPKDAPLPLPPGYFHLLADPMGESPVPIELESRYAEFMAWSDQQFAANALAAWDGKGVLVMVVDRLHVEGGLGVSWQVQRMTDVPVQAAMLADAKSVCYAGDLIIP